MQTRCSHLEVRIVLRSSNIYPSEITQVVVFLPAENWPQESLTKWSDEKLTDGVSREIKRNGIYVPASSHGARGNNDGLPRDAFYSSFCSFLEISQGTKNHANNCLFSMLVLVPNVALSSEGTTKVLFEKIHHGKRGQILMSARLCVSACSGIKTLQST